MPALTDRVQYDAEKQLGIMTAEAVAATIEAAQKVERANNFKIAIMGAAGTAGEKQALLVSHADGGVSNGDEAAFDTLLGTINTTLQDASFQGYLRRLDKGASEV